MSDYIWPASRLHKGDMRGLHEIREFTGIPINDLIAISVRYFINEYHICKMKKREGDYETTVDKQPEA